MAYDMRSVDDQLARVLDPVRPLPAIDVGLQDARGCILAEDVTAPWPLPPFDNAAMDGYAVLTGSVVAASPSMPVRLNVIEDIPAGSRPTSTVAAGTAARIMTGAPMPRGADAVVPVENTDGQMPVVTIYQPTAVGRHVRRAGDDIPSGEIVLKAGTVMEARQTALAAAVGRGRVRVHPRPRVVVISTGDELVEPGRPIGPGLINDVNGIMLAVASLDLGAEAYQVGPISDDAKVLASTLQDQLVRADLIITTGGVSAGAYDTVKSVLSQLGTVEFVKVAMQPGKPQGYGHIDGTPIFNLPGNPVSAFVSFEVFVRPVLRRLLGYTQLFRPTVEARAAQAFDSPAGKRQFARGQLSYQDGDWQFHASMTQGSHQIGMLAHANSIAVVAESVEHVPAGTPLTVMRLDVDHGA